LTEAESQRLCDPIGLASDEDLFGWVTTWWRAELCARGGDHMVRQEARERGRGQTDSFITSLSQNN
jgi:hypothetical protein